MLSQPQNKAAYLTGAKVHPLEIRSAPYTSPGAHQILIKNHAVAINPVDWIKQELGDFLYSWIKYPFVLGFDVAGEVVEVGPEVKRFKVGDRVIGLSIGMEKKVNRTAESGFQHYSILRDHLSSPIPDSMTYEQASVIPLGLSTAATGFYDKDQLALPFPTVDTKPNGKTLLIWGGSTSVGCNAIQLAIASGFEVITTSSPRNFELCKSLGASQVFDYNSKTVVQDIIIAFKGRTLGGAFSIGAGGAEACMDIIQHCTGNKFLAMATYPSNPNPPKSLVMLNTILYFISWQISHFIKEKTRGIRSKFIWGGNLADSETGPAVWNRFLPEALERGLFVASPEPQVFGAGLENVQGAMDLQKKGVSAKKIVVTL